MHRISTDLKRAGCTALMLAMLVLAGCATSKDELLTHDGQTMHDIWSREAGNGGRAARELLDARQSLRRPLTTEDVQAAPREQAHYTRTAHISAR